MGSDIASPESETNPVLTKNLDHKQNILPLYSVLPFKVKKEKEEGHPWSTLHSTWPGSRLNKPNSPEFSSNHDSRCSEMHKAINDTVICGYYKAETRGHTVILVFMLVLTWVLA